MLEERPGGGPRRAPAPGASGWAVNSAARPGGAAPPGLAGHGPRVFAGPFARFVAWRLEPAARPVALGRAAQRRGGPRVSAHPARPRPGFFQLDDGLYPWLIVQLRSRYQSFGPRLTAANVAGLAVTARPLDTLLLRRLPPAAFRQEAETLRQRLTDAAIDSALQAGPPETRAAVAARLRPALRRRRAQLPAVAEWFYEAVNK